MIDFEYPYIYLLLSLFIICQIYCKRINQSKYIPHIAFFDFSKSSSLITFLRYMIVLLLLTALASPVKSLSKPPNENEGVNIVLALDASGSMNQSRFDEQQRDKSKFDLVKDVAKEFITNRGEDNIGIVLFGDFAFVSTPITYEKEIVKEFIERYEVGVAGESTAIGEALYKSAQALNITNSKSKVIILLTDGKHNSGKISPQRTMEYINE